MAGLEFQNDTALFSPLASYQGFGGSEAFGQTALQSGFGQSPGLANFAQANQFVQAAAQTSNPNQRIQLLQQALAALSSGGTGASAGEPSLIGTQRPPLINTQMPSLINTQMPSLIDAQMPQPIATTPVSPIATTPVAPFGSSAGSTPLSVSGNSVNTGEYTITASTKDDGSLTITNNQTGQSTEVWGDPHIKVNGQDTADFQTGPLNIQLQDGTVVHIDPTALQNGVAHIGQVSITKGNQSVEMGGSGPDGFAGGVHTSALQTGDAAYQTGLYNAPNATDITLGADGNLYYNNANGSMGKEITAKAGGGETDLDGHGGGLVKQPITSPIVTDPIIINPGPIGSPILTGKTSPISSSGASSTPNGLSASGNSVNTGEYTITASTKDNGSLTITNNQTGQSTEIWGDPHIKVNGQDTAEFQNGPLNIQLQDGTVVHIDPTALQNGVAHIGQVSITKGNQAVTMGGSGAQGFADSVSTSKVMNGEAGYQSGLYNTPNATDITLGADGNLYYNNANGSMGKEITAKASGGETDLDGAGGGLVGQPRTTSGVTTGPVPVTSSAQEQQLMQAIYAMLAKSEMSFYSTLMQQAMSSMMSHSHNSQS
jgi:phosphoheptose isomerase